MKYEGRVSSLAKLEVRAGVPCFRDVLLCVVVSRYLWLLSS